MKGKKAKEIRKLISQITGYKVTDNQAMKRLYRGAKKQIWAKE